MSDTAGPGSSDGWSREHTAALALVVLFGWTLRLKQYLANPSLWNDEQLLALNVGRRSFLGLLRPLEHDQSAPLGFLELERLITRVFGMGDLALRLLPFLAGLALVLLGVAMARRLVRPDTVVLAALCLAVSPAALHHARDLKPYESDAAISALLTWLTLRLLDQPGVDRWRHLGLAGIVAVWFSSPALFVLTAVGLALLAAPGTRSDPAWRRRLAITLAAWLASGGLNYFAILRPSSAAGYLHRYMAANFIPLDHPGRAWALYRGELLTDAFIPAGYLSSRDACAAVVLLLAVAGVVVLWRRSGPASTLLFSAPFAVSLGAALAGVYPVVTRLQLWLVPTLIALVLVAIDAGVARLPSAAGRVVVVALGLVLLATAGRFARYQAFNITAPENARPLVREWRERNSGEPVYVAARAAPGWTFYSTDWKRPDTERLDWYAGLNGSLGRAFRNAPGRGPVRDDGADLVRRSPTHVELLGIPSGIQVTLSGLSQEAPDSGWADNEARRIRAAASPAIWLFFNHHIRSENRAVMDAVERLGGRKELERIEPGAALYRVRF